MPQRDQVASQGVAPPFGFGHARQRGDGHRGSSDRYRLWGKRLVDLLLAAPALVVVAPLVVILLAAAAADGHKPLFVQARIGRGGVPFRCYKIRTMVPAAAERLAEILISDPGAAEEWGETRKLTNDPRVTRVGRFLRKTSLDELPQLWNVLRGDMSLVGPRPIVDAERERYGKELKYYVRGRPGLTGLWQVSGRNLVTYGERVALDVRYVRSFSLVGDLTILLKTVGSVLCRTGA